ncbi:M20/M25/M40 family metallo-hydrolase [Weissella confusa]|uniref:M20/M25/M40 family metallo-hydrolase n=1 Tax=Weissella confusa TaxID=1583 RepID=A0A923SMY1_WEICO|nr:M20/M25/M40 family metallo-hydrolase [Weissella confusa]
MPTMGFSPDAEFPIINGEKGNVSIVTRFAGTQGGSLKLVSFSAGSRPNMVPGTAVAVVEAADPKDPWSPVIEDGRLYARGASDDKGPSFTAYYAMKMIKDLNLDLKRKLVLVMGIDEESDWTGMDEFFSATEDAPLGPGPKEALLKFEEFAKRDGFRTGNYKNLVAYAELGPEDAEETVAIIGHLDVMPAGDGWQKVSCHA